MRRLPMVWSDRAHYGKTLESWGPQRQRTARTQASEELLRLWVQRWPWAPAGLGRPGVSSAGGRGSGHLRSAPVPSVPLLLPTHYPS